MDVLITNSSKSYYACVGESTHAYQSPSKDLTAINDRLNRHMVDTNAYQSPTKDLIATNDHSNRYIVDVNLLGSISLVSL